MTVIVPPGGFAGLAQMTPASRASWGSAGGMKRGGTRKRRGRASGKRAGASRRRRGAGGARKKRASGLKFGSKAWQAKYNPRMKRKRRK